MNKLVYLAAPYSHPDQAVMTLRNKHINGITAQAKAAVQAIAAKPPTATQATQSEGAPSLRLGSIQERLGLPVSADFLAGLGFKHSATAGAAKLYHEADFPLICDALVRHINAAKHIGTRVMAEVLA